MMPLQLQPKNKSNAPLPVKLAAVILLAVFSFGCEKTNTSDYSPPADHTIRKDGFMHKTGLEQPMTNCISCHGADLKGGSTGVSCFECHGKEW